MKAFWSIYKDPKIGGKSPWENSSQCVNRLNVCRITIIWNLWAGWPSFLHMYIYLLFVLEKVQFFLVLLYIYLVMLNRIDMTFPDISESFTPVQQRYQF